MRRLALPLIALLLLLACGRPIDRPLSGALPGEGGVPTSAVPPTLVGTDLRFGSLPSPSPGLPARVAPSPSPSPGARPPIVRTIQPAANGHVPRGAPVVISAVLVGRDADLVSATLVVDGVDLSAPIERRGERQWTIAATKALPDGQHTARVLVRDTSGAAGGFTWRFTVGDETQTPTPAPARTPKPLPAPSATPGR